MRVPCLYVHEPGVLPFAGLFFVADDRPVKVLCGTSGQAVKRKSVLSFASDGGSAQPRIAAKNEVGDVDGRSTTWGLGSSTGADANFTATGPVNVKAIQRVLPSLPHQCGYV